MCSCYLNTENCEILNGKISYERPTEVLTRVTHVNGWQPALFFICHNFRLLHVRFFFSFKTYVIFCSCNKGPGTRILATDWHPHSRQPAFPTKLTWPCILLFSRQTSNRSRNSIMAGSVSKSIKWLLTHCRTTRVTRSR